MTQVVNADQTVLALWLQNKGKLPGDMIFQTLMAKLSDAPAVTAATNDVSATRTPRNIARTMLFA